MRPRDGALVEVRTIQSSAESSASSTLAPRGYREAGVFFNAFKLVHGRGLEPLRLSAVEPKAANPENLRGSSCDSSADRGSVVTPDDPSRTSADTLADTSAVDPIEASLARALDRASEAGEWGVVQTIAAQLDARRLTRSSVPSLADARTRKGR